MAGTILSDRLTVEIAADLSPLSRSLAEAGRDVNQFASGTIGAAAKSMTGAFDSSFGAMERSVARAARSGRLSIQGMVDAMLADLARIAAEKFIVPGIESALGSLSSGGNLFAGLAVGGPVGPGSAYLVGERGPEIFVPSGNGQIVPSAAAPARPQIVVNVQTPNAQSFLKSESQIAAMMARALARGQKNL